MSSVIIQAERPDSPAAMMLIEELEAVLAPGYPAESRHGFSVDKLIRNNVAFFITRIDGEAVACGGIQLFGQEYGELKRMYVRPGFQGQGLAKRMLDHLANYAQTHGVHVLRLETGIYQESAIRLYERFGFQRIQAFGEYVEDPMSIFYELRLQSQAQIA